MRAYRGDKTKKAMEGFPEEAALRLAGVGEEN